MNKRILVISWFYPPINSSEGLVTYKLLKASKSDYDVFTQKSNPLWSYGNKDYLPDCKNINTIFSKVDNLDSWVTDAIEFYNANMDKYDIVMTRSMPPESHKIGLAIKKINPKIKWIASFGDPIAENPYTKISLTYESPHSVKNCANLLGVISPKRIIKNTIFKIKYKRQRDFYLKKDLKLQNSIFKYADTLIFNSEYQKNYMLDKQSSEIIDKALVLNHSYDASLYPEKEKKNDKIKFCYIGHLDTIRTPLLLLKAIRKLYKENPNLSEKAVFEFYGHMSDSDKLYIINHELTDVIKVKNPVSYLKSLEIMQSSDWLLHIDADISSVVNENIFFAAKLADYIGTGNSIFGITMLSGISADILKNLNALSTSYSAQEIKNYLWLIIYNNYTLEINKDFQNEFNSLNVAKKFDEYILKLNS